MDKKCVPRVLSTKIAYVRQKKNQSEEDKYTVVNSLQQ